MRKRSESPKFEASTAMFMVENSWRLLLIAFLVGGLVGAAIYSVFPPQYRARTVITIDHNLEAIFPTSPDREIFYFLERETNKLEELAWSDKVMEATSQNVGGITVTALRGGVLQLSQPGDGGWKLYATDRDPQRAKLIVNAWGDAFVDTVRAAAGIEQERAGLQDIIANGKLTGTDDLAKIKARLSELDEISLGISPMIELLRSQKSDIQVERKSSQGLYIFAGAMIALIVMLIIVIIYPIRFSHKDAKKN